VGTIMSRQLRRVSAFWGVPHSANRLLQGWITLIHREQSFVASDHSPPGKRLCIHWPLLHFQLRTSGRSSPFLSNVLLVVDQLVPELLLEVDALPAGLRPAVDRTSMTRWKRSRSLSTRHVEGRGDRVLLPCSRGRGMFSWLARR
jgi:hypothetical protein